MEQPIIFSSLNDFIFCPASIYFHKLYENLRTLIYQSEYQINGKIAHESIDEQTYSACRNILQGTDVYCEKYNLIGKIDLFDIENGVLTERKKLIKNIYDGYVFQVYAQCFALRDMGYTVNKIRLHSLDDNKNYDILLPENDPVMLSKFERLIKQMNEFDISKFVQNNPDKCSNCIYEPYCDRALE